MMQHGPNNGEPERNELTGPHAAILELAGKMPKVILTLRDSKKDFDCKTRELRELKAGEASHRQLQAQIRRCLMAQEKLKFQIRAIKGVAQRLNLVAEMFEDP